MPLRPLVHYARWLHTRWPAGSVEKLPVINDDGSTRVAGLYVVGDLAGVPLLKMSVDAGTRAVRRIAEQRSFKKRDAENVGHDVLDIAIIGGGTAGFAAAREAQRLGLRYMVFEAAQPFATIANFPKAKPIYTYPTRMTPAGELQFHDKADVKEGLLEDLREQTVRRGVQWALARASHVERKAGLLEVVFPDGVADGDEQATSAGDEAWLIGRDRVRARRVIVAIGRAGNYRTLEVPGEDEFKARGKVFNRLHDPADYGGQDVLVVGGGDSALEAAIALAMGGARVTLSYRREQFSRPKPENAEKIHALAENSHAEAEVDAPTDERQATAAGRWMDNTQGKPDQHPSGTLRLMMASHVKAIRADEVDMQDAHSHVKTLPNDVVFAMIGREAPLDFFRRSGVPVVGDRGLKWWLSLGAFLLFCMWMYHWKADYAIPFGLKDAFNQHLGVTPARAWEALQSWGGATGAYFSAEGTLGHTLAVSASGRSFYYTLAYAVTVVVFGLRRIRRRKTPYVTWQTATLMAIQVVPLFLLPEILLPWAGHNGWWDAGVGRWFADTFFPAANYGHGREYWRAYGFVLAWPLMAWNWFTTEPLWGWLILGVLQTFVAIPAMVYFWGKGAYCGWICSCGALAETLGDQHRHKMPHGPLWNRLNMVGQGFLFLAVIIMALRVAGWAGIDWADTGFTWTSRKLPLLSWQWMVDLFWAGVLGVGLYFHFSGRVWCRFACPLAALMHIYARFSRFRILSEKSKCISCNVCTSVCHQGIDVMAFANKGKPMADPQCVRCSACVQSCPTGVLSFGQVDRDGQVLTRDPDWLAASPVRMAELTIHGRSTN